MERRPEADAAWLAGRVGGVAAAFGPGSEAEVAAAVYNGGLELLESDAAALPQALITLKTALPGVNVLSVASREPRLLYTPGAAAAAKKVVTKLTQVYPYKSATKKQDVLALVAEYPELLVRMTHYADDASIKKVRDIVFQAQSSNCWPSSLPAVCTSCGLDQVFWGPSACLGVHGDAHHSVAQGGGSRTCWPSRRSFPSSWCG
ncbi:MAG: hypothetical protein J3K34DRAFT_404918 [Monoraphidium minutum]|nr:MAG: hypothetical protein J3K34DRAFT_404918 [Monoraphidium minutum]